VTFNDTDYALEIYKNGQRISYTTQTSGGGTVASDSSYNFGIGATPDTGFYSFDGYLDEVKIYDYARTPAQIAWDYNKGGPIAYWDFDECAGSVIHDQTGNGYDGTLHLGTSGVTATGTCAESGSSFWYNGRDGKIDSAGSFDAWEDDYVVTPSMDASNLTGISLSFWLKSSDNDGMVVSWANYRYCKLDSDGAGNHIECSVDGGASSVGPNPIDGQWHHIVYTSTNNSQVIYMDGVSRQTNSETLNTANSGAVYFGRHSGGGYPFVGQLDEVKIFNYALTPEQVRIEYNNGAVSFR
jgi:hypothetical protein